MQVQFTSFAVQNPPSFVRIIIHVLGLFEMILIKIIIL